MWEKNRIEETSNYNLPDGRRCKMKRSKRGRGGGGGYYSPPSFRSKELKSF